MSEINVIRDEMQAKFEQDLKDFKEKLIAKMEREIADTVKTSVKSALTGINAQINSSLQENNKNYLQQHAGRTIYRHRNNVQCSIFQSQSCSQFRSNPRVREIRIHTTSNSIQKSIPQQEA
jgi:hypothetical protein